MVVYGPSCRQSGLLETTRWWTPGEAPLHISSRQLLLLRVPAFACMCYVGSTSCVRVPRPLPQTLASFSLLLSGVLHTFGGVCQVDGDAMTISRQRRRPPSKPYRHRNPGTYNQSANHSTMLPQDHSTNFIARQAQRFFFFFFLTLLGLSASGCRGPRAYVFYFCSAGLSATRQAVCCIERQQAAHAKCLGAIAFPNIASISRDVCRVSRLACSATERK